MAILDCFSRLSVFPSAPVQRPQLEPVGQTVKNSTETPPLQGQVATVEIPPISAALSAVGDLSMGSPSAARDPSCPLSPRSEPAQEQHSDVFLRRLAQLGRSDKAKSDSKHGSGRQSCSTVPLLDLSSGNNSSGLRTIWRHFEGRHPHCAE